METMEAPGRSQGEPPEWRAQPGAHAVGRTTASGAERAHWFGVEAADQLREQPGSGWRVEAAWEMDIVDLAGEESFPASDPPAWTSGREPGAWE